VSGRHDGLVAVVFLTGQTLFVDGGFVRA